MKLPKGTTEKEVVTIVNNIVNRLAYKFKFGYHDLDDIKQQARLFALEGLKNYDNKRPLENFLYIHVRNRLCNYKRDNFERPDKPCYNCPLNAYDPYYLNSYNQCTKFNDKMSCDVYSSWTNRNRAKKNLMNPIELSVVVDGKDGKEDNMRLLTDVLEDTSYKEIGNLINKNISVGIRPLFIKMMHNDKLTKVQKDKVINEIYRILEENDISI